jgi:hypothetical protein
MRPRGQPSAIRATLYDARHGPAIDLKMVTEIPSEVRRSVNDKAARGIVVIRPEITSTSLRKSANEHCAPENRYQKNVPREAVL